MTKFVSFARNMEDVLLRRALRDIDHGFYIDLGAAEADMNSVTRGFYEAGWNGINIGTDRRGIERLARRLRDVSLLADQTAEGMSFAPIGPENGVAGADWKQHVPPGQAVHFLKVDADRISEGMIENGGLTELRPWIVLLSSAVAADARIARLDAFERPLLAGGYARVYSDGFNRFYLSPDAQHLKERLQTPPNASDDFVTCREKKLENELFRLRAELDSSSASKREVVRLYSKLLEQPNTTVSLNQHDSFHEQPLLRRLNPERIIRRAIRRRFPKKPQLGTLLPSQDGYVSDTRMLKLEFPDFTLNFATNALNDERGVGRVAKSQLKELQKREVRVLPESMVRVSDRPVVNFFPSIHWCPRVLPPNSVLMIHDVIPLVLPHVFPDHIVREWIYKFATVAQSASHIVTISNSSATDISAVLDIPRERISVIHNGVDISSWQDESRSKIELPSEPYFVCIGSRDYHKNLDVVYQAIRLPEARDCKLLVVGNGFKGQDDKADPMIKERVRFLGRLSDSDLAHVVKGARALLFPSIYEGFGLPPLEAALLGVPTIASARPAMTEILTQGVQFCQPDNPLEWAVAMRDFLEREPDEGAAVRLKRHVSETYSWCRSVDELLQVLKGACELAEGDHVRN